MDQYYVFRATCVRKNLHIIDQLFNQMILSMFPISSQETGGVFVSKDGIVFNSQFLQGRVQIYTVLKSIAKQTL